MKQKINRFLFLGCYLLAFSVGAQINPKSKVPNSSTTGSRGAGSYQQAFLPDGTLIRKNANGRESLVVSAVPMSIQAVRTINSANPSLAPKVIHITDSNAGGDFVLDTTDKTTPDNIGRILVTKNGLRYKRFITDGQINVRWYSTNTNTGEGTQNDAAALQATINDAHTYNAKSRGTVRLDVVLGNGYFALDKPIDATNAPGLTIRGGNGRYFNCTVLGNTGGVIIDLTGSGQAQVEGITFLSDKNSSHPSTTGLLFALSQNDKGERLGGLNCSLINCFFRLDNNPTFNGGMGTIGVMNIRSEEFHMSRCFIQANTPVVFSNRNNLNLDTPYPLTVTSPYAKIASDMTGSMGVVDMTGENSFQSFQRLSPALVLNGVNSLLFHGYIGRIGDLSVGKEESAVAVYQPTYNIQLGGTIEGYSTAMRLHTNCKLVNSTVNFVLANQNDPTQPVMWMYPGSQIQGSKVSYSFGNPNEIQNRTLIYAQPMNNGNALTTCSIINSDIISTQFPDNTLAVSANLLKNCHNVTFGTQQPFEKKGVWVRSLIDTP